MRKYRDGDFWFEITTGPAPDGSPGARYYAVSCRRCSAHASYHASGTSNEGLRKIFIRAGWTLGKNRFKHYCPECTKRHAASPATQRPSPAPTAPHHTTHIQELWADLSADEQVRFWHWLHEHYACWVGNSGRISLIAAASQPQPQPQPPEPVEEVSAELTLDDDDDDVADWWKELTASKQAKSGDANEN